jgi:hypothetical protein
MHVSACPGSQRAAALYCSVIDSLKPNNNIGTLVSPNVGALCGYVHFADILGATWSLPRAQVLTARKTHAPQLPCVQLFSYLSLWVNQGF